MPNLKPGDIKRALTIYEIARLAGASQSIVFRVLNCNKPVAPEIQANILKIVEEPNHRSNMAARGLFQARSGQYSNADVNGSYNIRRKVVPNAFADGIGAVAVQPVRVYTTCQLKVWPNLSIPSDTIPQQQPPVDELTFVKIYSANVNIDRINPWILRSDRIPRRAWLRCVRIQQNMLNPKRDGYSGYARPYLHPR